MKCVSTLFCGKLSVKLDLYMMSSVTCEMGYHTFTCTRHVFNVWNALWYTFQWLFKVEHEWSVVTFWRRKYTYTFFNTLDWWEKIFWHTFPNRLPYICTVLTHLDLWNILAHFCYVLAIVLNNLERETEIGQISYSVVCRQTLLRFFKVNLISLQSSWL